MNLDRELGLKIDALCQLDFLKDLPCGMAVFDPQLCYVWINPTLAKINGLLVEDHLGKPLRKVLPALAPSVEPILFDVLQSGNSVVNIVVSGKLMHIGDPSRSWSASYLPLKSDAGVTIGVFALVEEVTERLEYQNRILEQSRMLEAVFRYTLDCVVLLDSNYNFIRVNDTYAKLTGRAACEFIGKNHFDLYPSDAKAMFDEVIKTKTATQTFARPFVFPDHPDWGITYWDWNLVPILDSKNEVEFLIFSLRDVTERKRAELELTKKQNEFEALANQRGNEIKFLHRELLQKERLAGLGQLVATVSHELRNPLSAILASSYLLKKQLTKERGTIASVLDSLCKNVDRCNRIIEELLEYVKISDLHKENTEIDPWLQKLLEEQIKPPQVNVRMISSSRATVAIDRARLTRCVINVLSNAFQSMEDFERQRHQLTVETRVSRGRVEMRFSDTGRGISHSHKDRIFEPLFSTKSFGIGLGLPIVKQIMEKHGGGVEIDSVESEGTTVTLWLPYEHP